jgi:hypothetical protein
MFRTPGQRSCPGVLFLQTEDAIFPETGSKSLISKNMYKGKQVSIDSNRFRMVLYTGIERNASFIVKK